MAGRGVGSQTCDSCSQFLIFWPECIAANYGRTSDGGVVPLSGTPEMSKAGTGGMSEVVDDEELKVEIEGSMAHVIFDRPRALNALTTVMRRRFSESLWSFARDPQVYAVVMESSSDRAFSAGSDVREVVAWGQDDRARARAAFRDEYALNWQCECFSKPIVPLINGIVMGGAVGITLFGTHRVAGEGYRFAMPETLIGLFPDVGVCHVFARLPDHIGLYLGLTGRTIERADAYELGLLTHTIPSGKFAEIKTEIADTWPVDTVLDSRQEDPGEGELVPYRETISRCFSAPTVEEIVARLEFETGSAQVWAQETADELKRRSPISLKVTHRHIREARNRDLRETLTLDYRLACRFLEGRDFYEGVRASLIDKDGTPVWCPKRLEDVTASMVEAYFSPLEEEDELGLATREEMQALRA
jgi:enoyl-CoA hydratase/carnithine racemase